MHFYNILSAVRRGRIYSFPFPVWSLIYEFPELFEKFHRTGIYQLIFLARNLPLRKFTFIDTEKKWNGEYNDVARALKFDR